MQLTYIGPHDAVDVDLPIDAHPKTEIVTVVKGDSHEFSKEDAKRLLEQPSNWEQAGGKSKTTSPADAGEKE
jgi:hypothetical protein